MRDELRVLNALVEMTLPSPGWPDHLHRLGFTLVSLQRDVSLDLAGRRRTVTPEAVFQSQSANCCFIVESKSATLDEGQAERYAALSVRDLVASGAAQDVGDVDGAHAAPAYFCQALHTAELGGRLGDFNRARSADLPLVDHDNHRFKLQLGRIRLAQLHDDFDGGIYFNALRWPTGHVPFDAESPLVEVAPRVLNELIAFLVREEIREFTATDIAGGSSQTGTDGCIPFFGAIGRSAKRQILGKVSEVVDEFRRHYASDVYSRAGGPQRWEKLRSAGHQKTQAALFGKTSDYLRRKREGANLPSDRQSEQLLTDEELELGATDREDASE